MQLYSVKKIELKGRFILLYKHEPQGQRDSIVGRVP